METQINYAVAFFVVASLTLIGFLVAKFIL